MHRLIYHYMIYCFNCLKTYFCDKPTLSKKTCPWKPGFMYRQIRDTSSHLFTMFTAPFQYRSVVIYIAEKKNTKKTTLNTRGLKILWGPNPKYENFKDSFSMFILSYSFIDYFIDFVSGSSLHFVSLPLGRFGLL